MATGKIKYPKREALRMLSALENQVAALQAFEAATEYTVGALSTDRYADFRAKTGEIYTLSIVVRARVENLDSGRDPELQERFDRLVVEAQRVIIRASLKFMEVLSKLEALPLGAREIFTTELSSLHDAHERLKDPRLRPYIVMMQQESILAARCPMFFAAST